MISVVAAAAPSGSATRNGPVSNSSQSSLSETLSHSAVEAELIDQRKLNREEIAAAYDVPPPLIGILDRATFSNIQVQAKMLYGMVLGPWLALVKTR